MNTGKARRDGSRLPVIVPELRTVSGLPGTRNRRIRRSVSFP